MIYEEKRDISYIASLKLFFLLFIGVESSETETFLYSKLIPFFKTDGYLNLFINKYLLILLHAEFYLLAY